MCMLVDGLPDCMFGLEALILTNPGSDTLEEAPDSMYEYPPYELDTSKR